PHPRGRPAPGPGAGGTLTHRDDRRGSDPCRPRGVPHDVRRHSRRRVRSELLPNGHRWYRIADPGWADPVDPGFSERLGGRWNPPDSFPVLSLNEDIVTARINLRLFIEGWPYEPEDLRDDN